MIRLDTWRQPGIGFGRFPNNLRFFPGTNGLFGLFLPRLGACAGLSAESLYFRSMEEAIFRSGFVSIIGKPNAGKSTLLNALVGKKLAITTPKAQTTRHRILGIDHGPGYQVIFSDTPGVILPQYRLHKAMMNSVKHSLEDADLILLLVDVHEKFPESELFRIAAKPQIPILLVINKVDLADDEKVAVRKAEILEKVKVRDEIAISALHGTNVKELKAKILGLLPEGPPYFDEDSLSDRPERFFVTELIREKIFLNMEQEIPYSCEVGILTYEEEEKIDRIRAEIFVDRASLKGMLIGKRGAMVKKIGSEARMDIEAFLQKKVFLDLYVRVAENWKDSSFRLRDFGYQE